MNGTRISTGWASVTGWTRVRANCFGERISPATSAQNVQQFIQFCPEVKRYTATAAGDRVLFVRIPPKRMNFQEPYRLCCFNAQTGAQQWSSESGTLSGYSFSCVPLVVDETVYATASTNNGTEMFLVAINITNGRSLWTLSLGQATTSTNWRGMPQVPVCNLLYDGGKVYVLTNNGALVCVNTGEKRLLWAMTMEGPPIGASGFNNNEPVEKLSTPAAMFLRDNVLYRQRARRRRDVRGRPGRAEFEMEAPRRSV